MSVSISKDLRVTAAFYFEVVIDGAVVSFQEVSGLNFKNDIIKYRHGNDVQNHVDFRVGLQNVNEVTCVKGIFEGDDTLQQLYERTWNRGYMSHTDDNFDMTISLFDETGAVVCHWEATDCIVVSMDGPSLKSDTSAAAIEKIVIQPGTLNMKF